MNIYSWMYLSAVLTDTKVSLVSNGSFALNVCKSVPWKFEYNDDFSAIESIKNQRWIHLALAHNCSQITQSGALKFESQRL